MWYIMIFFFPLLCPYCPLLCLVYELSLYTLLTVTFYLFVLPIKETDYRRITGNSTLKKKLSSSSNVLIKIFGTSIGDCSGQLAVQIGMACTWPDWHKPIQQWRDKLGRRKRERRREVERGGSEMAAAAAVTVVGGPAIACRGCWRAIKASPAPCHPIRFLIEENRRKSKGTGWPGRHQRWWPKNR